MDTCELKPKTVLTAFIDTCPDRYLFLVSNIPGQDMPYGAEICIVDHCHLLDVVKRIAGEIEQHEQV